MNAPRYLSLVLALLLGGFSASLRAEEQTTTYRLVGLFEPSRQDDFRQMMTEVPELQIASLDFEKAEVTFRYDPSTLFPDGKVPKNVTPEKLTERIAGLINVKSKGTFRITPPSIPPADQQTRVDIKIGILDCRGCRYGAYLLLSKIDGVERATVSTDTPTITAWIDPARTNREALEAALKKAQVALPAP